MAQLKNNPILLDNTTKLFGVRDNVPGEVVPGFLGVHNLMHVQDIKNGDEPGTFTAGAYRTRDLNTVKLNNIAGASLASNQITLQAGNYYCDSLVPAYRAQKHSSVLRNITASSVLILGSIESANNGNYVGSSSTLSGRFVLTEESVLEVQHICSVSGYFGTADGDGVSGVLTDLKIWKIA